MPRLISRSLHAIFIFLLPWVALSQQTAVFDDPEHLYQKGIELFLHEKFTAARQVFEKVSATPEISPFLHAESNYHLAACAAELTHEDVIHLLRNFIRDYPDSKRSEYAHFLIGRSYFRSKNFKNALENFEEIDTRSLNNQDLAGFYYMKGFCLLQQDDFDKAQRHFSQVINTQTIYAIPATYYNAYIYYEKRNFASALKGFEQVKNENEFNKTVPYYIAQCHYNLGHLDEFIATASSMYDNAPKGDKKKSELGKLLGHVYFRKGEYTKAAEYYSESLSTQSKPTSNEQYELAYSYFMNDQFQEAIPAFQPLTFGQDTLAQLANYYLGCCYIKTDQKQYAYKAFSNASKVAFNQGIHEESVFNTAKLSYELAFNPYNETVELLRDFIRQFPSSQRIDEAHSYLVNIFLNTRNYKEALEIIPLLKSDDTGLLKAILQIYYFRATELFNEARFQEAIELYKKCYETSQRPGAKPEGFLPEDCLFWIGESFSRTGNQWSTIKYLKEFINSAKAKQSVNYPIAYYSLGYASFHRKEFAPALDHFINFLKNPGKADQVMIADATLRKADCFMMQKNYPEAIPAYQEAIRMRSADKDYALLQLANTYGATGDIRMKIKTLAELISSHPKSKIIPEAIYELGISYMLLRDNNKAIESFQEIFTNYKNSGYVPRALLKTGIIQYNNDQLVAAANTFKQVIREFAGTQEAVEALASYRNISLETNKVNEFLEFTKDIPSANLSTATKDSLLYMAAENRFMDGKCDEARKGFTDYMQQFSRGTFIISARYYLAECDYAKPAYAEALRGYKFVADKPTNSFSENALSKVAGIYLSDKKYDSAAYYFTRLETVASSPSKLTDAHAGLMRSHFLSGNFNLATTNAKKLLDNEKTSDKLRSEALLISGKSAMQTGNFTSAAEYFRSILKGARNENAAESLYYLALIEFNNNNLKESEKLCFQLIREYGSFDTWVAKSFILLADVYSKSGNIYQAKQTLMSIIENHEGSDLVNEAREKLKQIESLEKPAENNTPSNPDEE
ncbi:MAG: tetratricopeptide repeat protein [Bacteroidetes bacterium]|nr:tetratricopeptide repeat protein [Bacteroidota bacterium]